MVLGVTNESKALVDKFVEKTGAKHGIVIESSDSAKSYGISGFPSSAIIGPDGKIAWTGHPASLPEAKIEELLKEVKLRPKLPESLSSVERSLDKGEYGRARQMLEEKLAHLEGEEKASAQKMMDWLDWKSKSMWDGAQESIRSGDYYAASVTLKEIEDHYQRTDLCDKAKDALKALEKDSAKKREIEAGETLEKVRGRLPAMKPERAAAMLRALARKYEGTKAGEKATALAADYEKRK